MKIAILVTSLLSLGASALPEAEESITVGEYTYTGGDLPKGELKAAMAAIHAMVDGICASQDLVPPYASDK
ncbi:hypothetical protein E4U30_000861 [Claviceps sp. LM220 group G6]|nr:hypothetical protein E4U30_000861 [Claviceps sp. LM220 group G6]KAG6111482.1 hypothetical protein E4U31_004360 [Claviceps sp. LM219 group G6]